MAHSHPVSVLTTRVSSALTIHLGISGKEISIQIYCGCPRRPTNSLPACLSLDGVSISFESQREGHRWASGTGKSQISADPLLFLSWEGNGRDEILLEQSK